ncbi:MULTISPECIES: tetratricopeptide repeat protein [unclassified Nocardia]|uniref:tetratricopeptide repeat protein n=1 Tax=unclassified Nocardia TaxID=2637762 RepID=UPI001CE4897C|nr:MULTISPECIES: tetratricopeptide repeat protein [unclassified Nocardia]
MVVPHEVPFGPRVFVNRESDFEWMEDFWASEATRVGVCTGLPGVGKTAFVRRCVERADGVFGDGELHVDFGAERAERTSVADALAQCLRALGVHPEVMPTTAAERANRLRTLTARKSVLIVLDNVTAPAEVLPFLPNSATSAVLVISTSRLTELLLEGAAVRELRPLDDAAGAHLIIELVGARAHSEPEAVSELVGQCAGLPVALTVAAAKLRSRPGLRIHALVAAITADERGLASFALDGRDKVTAVFSEGYAELGEDAARLYRLLGLFPGQDLTMDTVQALTGGDAATTDAAVGALVEAGLLAEDSMQRLSFHTLLKRHAAALAHEIDSAKERTAAIRAVTEYLVIKAAFADLAVLGPARYRCVSANLLAGRATPFDGADSRRAALDWLDAERMNLLAVQRMAADLGWHDWAWQLAESLTAVYVTRRYYTDWTVSSDIGATAAHLAGNARAEARLRSFVSRAWLELRSDTGHGLARAREELIDKALPLAEAAGDRRLLASVWEFVGRYRDVADPDNAGAAYERSLDLFRRENDARGQGFVMFFLARTQRRAGDLEQAESTMRAALELIRDARDPRMEGRSLIDLAEILTERGEHRRARDMLAAAIEVLAASGDAFYEAQALELRLRFAEADGDEEVRRATLTRMVWIHRNLGSDRADELAALLRRFTERS